MVIAEKIFEIERPDGEKEAAEQVEIQGSGFVEIIEFIDGVKTGDGIVISPDNFEQICLWFLGITHKQFAELIREKIH